MQSYIDGLISSKGDEGHYGINCYQARLAGLWDIATHTRILDHVEDIVGPDVIIETLKPASNGRGFIVRFYESNRQRGPVLLTSTRALQSFCRCDLLERDGVEVTFDTDSCTIDVSPFEIVSLRCRLSSAES